METLGASELLIILLLALLFFGANKLPEIGKGLGTAIRSFKSGLSDEQPAIVKSTMTPPSLSDHG